MPNLSSHADGTPLPVLIIAGLFVLAGATSAAWLAVAEPYLVLGMMLLLGLPHGATDHSLHAIMHGKGERNFYVFYLAIIGSYGLLWYFFAPLAFLVFIVASIYHFGQSNWVDVRYPNTTVRRIHYLLWGSGVLLTPILLSAGEAVAIVQQMTGWLLPVPTAATVWGVVATLGVANLLFSLLLYLKGWLGGQRLGRELLVYSLLAVLFMTNSLLLGFTVYFVAFHSLGSMRDQFAFFSDRLPGHLRPRLYTEIAFTVVGALAFCLIVWLGEGAAAALRPGVIGWVFMLISLLTLPHMLLVEQLYARWSPRRTASGTKNLSTSVSTERFRLERTIL